MRLEQQIELFAAINFAICGISHMMAPRAWAEFFIGLRSKGEAGVLVVAFIPLGFGSIVVAFHQNWSGIPAILTFIAYGQLLKALIYLTFPRFGLGKLELVTLDRARLFIIAGAIMVALAGLLSYNLLTSGSAAI